MATESLTAENFGLYFGSVPGGQSGITARFAGLPVTISTGGTICGFGHLDTSVFLPAANHLLVTEIDGENSEAELLANEHRITHRWAVLTDYTNPDDWEISTENIVPETPGAFPVTVLDA